MKISKTHWISMILAGIILLVDLIFLRDSNLFFFIIGIVVFVLALPFVIALVAENKKEKEKDERFLDFTRSLAENIKGGTPIGKSIINMSSKNFGSLTPHIQKLSNQITLGIPINMALETFADDIGLPTIKRAVALIKQAENSGGKIEDILDSVANSTYEVNKLKKERQATISNLIVQGYIIFFIFIGIMLIMQFKILPLTAEVGSINPTDPNSQGLSNLSSTNASERLARPFLYLLIVQGIFSGLAIGKLAEGTIKSGVKHSFILSIAAFLISTGSNAFI